MAFEFAVVFSLLSLSLHKFVHAEVKYSSLNISFSQSDWWEVEKLNDDAFQDMASDSLYLRKAELDDNFIHTCYEYRVVNQNIHRETKSGTFCYPSIVITGMPKCSTSALYALMSDLPEITASKFKENCPFSGSRSITQYFDSLSPYLQPGEVAIDGCIDLKQNMKVLVRDFSDLLWSTYNYWCSKEYDDPCYEGNHWTVVGVHTRSPRIFHDIVQGSINGTQVNSPLKGKRPCEEAKNVFRSYVQELWGAVDDEASMVMASEDLEKSPEVIWNRLATKIGLPFSHPKLNDFKQVRYNTQNAQSVKGDTNFIAATEHKPGLYEVSNFEPIWPETRNLLSQCWRDDCRWISGVTHHNYDCAASGGALASAANTPSVATALRGARALGAESESTAGVAVTTGGEAARAEERTQGTHGFLHKYVRICIAAIEETAQMRKSTLKEARNRSRTLLLTADATVRSKITSAINTAIGLKLVFDIELDTWAPGSTECQDADVIAATIQNFTHSGDQDGGKGTALRFHHDGEGKSMSTCNLGDESFERVIILGHDPLMSIWSHYYQQHNVSERFGMTASSKMMRFDWQHWEATALSYVDQMGDIQSLMIQDYGPAIAALPPENILFLKVEDLLFGSQRKSTLQTLLHYLGYDVPMDYLTCAYVLGISRKAKNAEQSAKYGEFRKLVQRAYASDDFLCRMQHKLTNGSDFSGLFKNQGNTTCEVAEGETTRAERGKTCRIRYTDKTFLDVDEVRAIPPALVANPTRDLFNMRLIVEHVTGVYTGSVTTNASALDIFHMEKFCGRRMSVIYALPRDLTVKFTKGGHSTISLNSHGKKKCMKGVIRGFDRAIIMVRDPFAEAWDKAYAQHCTNPTLLLDATGSSSSSSSSSSSNTSFGSVGTSLQPMALGRVTAVKGGHEHHNKCINQVLKSLVTIAETYLGTEHLMETKQALDITKVFKPENYIIVSYESLYSKVTRVGVLQEVLSFIKHPEMPPERLDCAFSFLSHGRSQGVTSMVTTLKQHPHVICAMKAVFEKKIVAAIWGVFKLRLFSDHDCSGIGHHQSHESKPLPPSAESSSLGAGDQAHSKDDLPSITKKLEQLHVEAAGLQSLIDELEKKLAQKKTIAT